jgi:hypothetical protein
MFLHITHVQYLQEYTLHVTFNSGIIKQVNLQDELEGDIFEPLRDLNFFKQVAIDPDMHTIAWPNGADFAPEFLDKIREPVHSQERQKRPSFSTMQPIPA